MTLPDEPLSVEQVRGEVRDWLAARFDERDPQIDDDRTDIIGRTPAGHDAYVAAAREFQRSLAEAGFAQVDLPLESGGRGLTRSHVDAIDEEIARFDTPSLRPLAIGMNLAKAVLLTAGSEEQRERYLPALSRADEQWCQLFSEPDSGSDLASLRTSAVRDGRGWRVSGQKVWSSYAADADYGMILARTDPTAAPPQAGLTMFVLPMDSPGVSVQPLVDMAGGCHFNQVFLDDVALDDGAVLGEVGQGWAVSTGILSTERSGYMGGSGGGRRYRQVRAAAEAAGRLDHPLVRQRIVSVLTDELILEWLRDRFVSGALLDGNPAAGSMMKVKAGSLEQRSAEFVVEVLGAAALAWDATDIDGDIAAHALAASRQARIAGGTHEIQRNLLGERVLGLPREPRNHPASFSPGP